MASILLRRWRLVTVPYVGHLYLHGSTPAAGFLALIWTDESETLLVWIGLWMAALVHAAGHLAAARCTRQLPESITLYPLWSTTRLFQSPARIADDMMMTVSGPLANGLLGGAILLAFDGLLDREPEWLGQWARIQIGYGAALSLPVFPLDGSRLLRLVLKLRMPERRAWEIAGFVSQATAAGVVLWSLIQGFWSLAFVGIVFYLLGRFSTLFLEIGKRLKESERYEDKGWSGEETDNENGPTITLTQTADGVWQQLEPSPSNESRTYY